MNKRKLPIKIEKKKGKGGVTQNGEMIVMDIEVCDTRTRTICGEATYRGSEACSRTSLDLMQEEGIMFDVTINIIL